MNGKKYRRGFGDKHRVRIDSDDQLGPTTNIWVLSKVHHPSIHCTKPKQPRTFNHVRPSCLPLRHSTTFNRGCSYPYSRGNPSFLPSSLAPSLGPDFPLNFGCRSRHIPRPRLCCYEETKESRQESWGRKSFRRWRKEGRIG